MLITKKGTSHRFQFILVGVSPETRNRDGTSPECLMPIEVPLQHI